MYTYRKFTDSLRCCRFWNEPSVLRLIYQNVMLLCGCLKFNPFNIFGSSWAESYWPLSSTLVYLPVAILSWYIFGIDLGDVRCRFLSKTEL